MLLIEYLLSGFLMDLLGTTGLFWQDEQDKR